MDYDQIPEVLQESVKHPSPDIHLLRMAVDRALMRSQRELWYMYAYDKRRPAEIARKLKVSRANISQRLKVIEKTLIKWCKEHKETYDAIKEAEDMASE